MNGHPGQEYAEKEPLRESMLLMILFPFSYSPGNFI